MYVSVTKRYDRYEMNNLKRKLFFYKKNKARYTATLVACKD